MTTKKVIARKAGCFSRAPAAALVDRTLPHGAKMVIAVLGIHADKSGRCDPSVETIAAEVNMTEQMVRRYLRRLEASPYLRTEARMRNKGGNATNVYQLLYPAFEIVVEQRPRRRNGRNSEVSSAGETLEFRPRAKPWSFPPGETPEFRQTAHRNSPLRQQPTIAVVDTESVAAREAAAAAAAAATMKTSGQDLAWQRVRPRKSEPLTARSGYRFGLWVYHERIRLGLSVAELGAKTGLGSSGILNIEEGVAQPGPAMKKRIIRVLTEAAEGRAR